MLERFANALLFRRMSADLGAIAAALTQQNTLLARLTDRLAPMDPPTERVEVRAETGVSHLDANEAYLAQRFVERTQADTGHIPDDDEVLIYLADEKTTDLHKRLATRDLDLERLRAAREW